MIGSCALKARVEEHLGVALAPGFFDKAEQYARRKLDLCNERAGRQYGEDGYGDEKPSRLFEIQERKEQIAKPKQGLQKDYFRKWIKAEIYIAALDLLAGIVLYAFTRDAEYTMCACAAFIWTWTMITGMRTAGAGGDLGGTYNPGGDPCGRARSVEGLHPFAGAPESGS